MKTKKKNSKRTINNNSYKVQDELKKIYKGAEKVLDKKSEEYKRIVTRHKGAWKKLADL